VVGSPVQADLRKVHSHGVLLLPSYVSRLQMGGANPRPQVRVVRETAAVPLEGDGSMGQAVAKEVMALAGKLRCAR